MHLHMLLLQELGVQALSWLQNKTKILELVIFGGILQETNIENLKFKSLQKKR